MSVNYSSASLGSSRNAKKSKRKNKCRVVVIGIKAVVLALICPLLYFRTFLLTSYRRNSMLFNDDNNLELSFRPLQQQQQQQQQQNHHHHHDDDDDDDFKPLNCRQIFKNLYEDRNTKCRLNKEYTCAKNDNNDCFRNCSLTSNDYINILNKTYTTIKNAPNFWISIHGKEFDKTRWSTLKFGQYYERKMTTIFHDILARYHTKQQQQQQQHHHHGHRSNIIVVDIGMNIGWYSLLSAAHDSISVVSFEPNEMHHERMCESMILNDWDDSKVEQYPYGIGDDSSSSSVLAYNSQFPGMARVFSSSVKDIRSTSQSKVKENVYRPIRIVTLDDVAVRKKWLDDDDDDNRNRPIIPILKIDVESYEVEVLRGASRFLSARLAQNIFCEVTRLPVDDREIVVRLMVEDLVERGYYLKALLNWVGKEFKLRRGETYPDPKNETYARDVTRLIFLEKYLERPLNTWWKCRECGAGEGD